MKPSERIDRMIAELDDWRGRTLAVVRRAVLDADPQIVEECGLDTLRLGMPDGFR